MEWFASLAQISKDVYCVVRSDLRGNNAFNFVLDNKGGIDWIAAMVNAITSHGDRIVLGIDRLAAMFERGQELLWTQLIERYGAQSYDLVEIKETGKVAYVPKEKVDLLPSKQSCSVLLLEPNSPIGLLSYVSTVEPPFHPIEVASMSCSIMAHAGLSSLFCSRGRPPSSQDIEVISLRQKLPLNMVSTPDCWYLITRTSGTPTQYDNEEFYLSFEETISKFQKYGDGLAYKIAVIEACRKYGLHLSCTSPYRKKIRETSDEKGKFTLAGPEDLVVPLHLKLVR